MKVEYTENGFNLIPENDTDRAYIKRKNYKQMVMAERKDGKLAVSYDGAISENDVINFAAECFGKGNDGWSSVTHRLMPLEEHGGDLLFVVMELYIREDRGELKNMSADEIKALAREIIKQ